MKIPIGIIAILVICSACADPPVKVCDRPVWLEVQQLVAPDSCRLDEQAQIQVEVILNGSSYSYFGPDVKNTDSGCTIRIMGEKDECQLNTPCICYEWHSFDISLSQTGKYIIEIYNPQTDDLVDTITVY